MHEYDCEFCGRELPTNEYLAFCHIVVDLVCACLFLIKMFSWMFYQSFKLGSLKNFPCRCNHKAKWHPVVFDLEPSTPILPSWPYFLFHYKFKRPNTNFLAACIICTLKSPKEPCFEFRPISNLIYLESLRKRNK